MVSFWEKSNWHQEDKHLKILKESPFQRPFPKLKIGKGLYIIRGPRQIGKSTWLKSILRDQIKQGEKCYYHSCENIRDHVELAELLKSLRGYGLILLDEICFVKEWARAIKYEVDSNNIKTIIITGSNAHDLRRGSERMPGRLDSKKQIELLPMDFFEFSKMRHLAKWKPLSRKEELELYFRIGGFPAALIEAGEKGKTPAESKNTYLSWIIGDALKIGKQEIYLKEILGQLALTTGSTISLQKLAQKTQIGSHHTAQSYIEILEDSYALRTLYAVNPNDGSFRFRKEKKFYFTDPLLFWIALEWSGLKQPDNVYAKIAELVAAEYLYRRYPRLGYYSSSKGEIDFYQPNQLAIEVKWASAATNLSKAYLDLKMPHKLVWTRENFLT